MSYYLKGKQCGYVNKGKGIVIEKTEVRYFSNYAEAKEGVSIGCNCIKCREAEEYNKTVV